MSTQSNEMCYEMLPWRDYTIVKGYWHDFDNVKQEVEEFVAEQGNLGYMPTAGQLNRAGHYSLVIAICKHGGFSVTAEKLGLVQRRKVRGYWQDFANVRQEIEDFVAECGIPGEMPSVLQLNLAGCRSLAVAINKHGGFDAVAQKLGLKAPNFTYAPAQNSVSEEQQVYEFA